MTAELDLIVQLRSLTTHEGARGFADDVALIETGGAKLAITHDMLVEGVHFLATDPPETVAWKLVAVNASDLASKGAKPLYAMMGYTLVGDTAWDRGFVEGLRAALTAFGVVLLGGDTVSGRERSLGLTLIGEADGHVPSRAGAREGDALFVTGTIGDAGAGLDLARLVECDPADPLVLAYRSPKPQLEAGRLLAPIVTAIMDVSDGLLIDASRLSAASGVGAMIDLEAIPLSQAYRAKRGDGRDARLAAATAGDDYQLLFTSNMPLPTLPCPVTRIGQIVRGDGVHLYDAQGAVPLPVKLGWLHH